MRPPPVSFRRAARIMRVRNLLFVTIALVAATTGTAAAQSRERGGFSYTFEREAGVEGGGRLALRETELRSGYQVWRGDGRTLVLGVRWTRYAFLSSAPILEDTTAHSLRFPIRFAHRATNGWSGFAVVTPAIRSDFETVTADDLGVNALALASRAIGDAWTLSAGIAYGQDFGRSRVFPALGAIWKPDDDWSVDLLFPRPRVTYQPDGRWAWTLGLEPGGDQWNLDLPQGGRDVALSEYRAGLGVEWHARPWLRFQLQSGMVFARELEVRDGRRKEDAVDVDDTWFVRAGLSIH